MISKCHGNVALIPHYNYDYLKMTITLNPLPSWGSSVLPDWAGNLAQFGNTGRGVAY